MNCPKCGAAQQEDAVECAACGVVFSRLRAGQARPAPTLPVNAVVPERITPLSRFWSHADVSYWGKIAGAIVFVIFGILWTMHSRRSRMIGEQALNDQLNEINQKTIERGRNLDARANRNADPSALPSDLTETEVKRLIAATDEMQQLSTVTLPKEFAAKLYDSTLDAYPSLAGAARDGLIEFDPPIDFPRGAQRPAIPADSDARESVQPTARGEAGILDGGATWVAQLGPRHVRTIVSTMRSGEGATVNFEWDFDSDLGNSLGPDASTRTGHATFIKDGTWRVETVGIESRWR